MGGGHKEDRKGIEILPSRRGDSWQGLTWHKKNRPCKAEVGNQKRKAHKKRKGEGGVGGGTNREKKQKKKKKVHLSMGML